MKVLFNLFLLVAVIITGRAHPLSEKTRRVTFFSEIGESGGDPEPHSYTFGGSNEADEFFGADTNVNGYEAMEQYFALDDYDLFHPSGRFFNGHLFRSGAQASASSEVPTSETVQHSKVTKGQLLSQGFMTGNLPGLSSNQVYKGLVVTPLGYDNSNTNINLYKGSLAGSPWAGEPLNKPGQGPGSVSDGTHKVDNSVIAIPHYGKYKDFRYNDGFSVNQHAQPILQSIPSIEKNKQMHPNGYNHNVNWYPYTRPFEGETLVQVEEEPQISGNVEASAITQGNDELPYQARHNASARVQTNIALENKGSQRNGETYFEKGSEAAQPGSVVETRLRKRKRPHRAGFSYRHREGGWYHG